MRYWISSSALTITLNALNEANKALVSVVSNARIAAYEEGTIGYGVNGEHQSWPLTAYPTQFSDDLPKYVHVAIPRSVTVGRNALVVFPPYPLDTNGYADVPTDQKDDEGNIITERKQIGSTDYWYVYLQGWITAPENGKRDWGAPIQYGDLGTNKAYDEGPVETDWYRWDKQANSGKGLVTFKKDIDLLRGEDGIPQIGFNIMRIGDAVLQWNKENNSLDVRNFLNEKPAHLTASGDLVAFGEKPNDQPQVVSYFKDLYDIKALAFGDSDNGKTVVWNGSAWVKGTAGDKVTKDAVVGALGFTPASAKDINDVEKAFSGSLNDIDVRITELEGKTYVTSWNDLTDKPTTLAGYGITDKVLLEGALNGYATEQWVTDKGYLTQSDADKRYVDVASAQTVTGVKTFSNGLRIGDAVLTFSDNKLTLTHKDSGKFVHLCASGDVVAYGTDPTQKQTVSYFKDLEDVKNPNSLTAIDAVWAKNGSTYGWKAATELGKTYVGSTYIKVSGTTISLKDDVVQAIGKGETAYGWGNHANAGYFTKHQTLQDLKLNYGERQATYNPRTGSTIDLPMFCVQGNLNNTDGKEVSAEESYIDWECKNTDLLSKSSELGRDNGFMLLNHGMYRYCNWYSNNGKREVSSARALLNFYISGISGSSLELSWDYDKNSPLKFRRTIDATNPNDRRLSHFWRAIVDESNIGTYMSDKNAGSAYKLSNTKTLWGQNFDGTQNVSGNITDVEHILPKSGKSYSIGANSEDKCWKNVYSQYFTSPAGMGVDLSAGNAVGHIHVISNGNVGIGTIDPKYKLDVNGSAWIGGDLRASAYYFGAGDDVRLESGNVYFGDYGIHSFNVGRWVKGESSPTQFLSVYTNTGITMAHKGLQLGSNPTNKDANGLLWWDEEHNALRVNGNIIAKGDLIAFGGANLSNIGILNVTGVNAGYIGTGELRTTYGGVIKDYGDNGNMLIAPKDTNGGAVVISGHELLSEYNKTVNIGNSDECRFGTAYINGINIKAPTGKGSITITEVYLDGSDIYFKVNGVQKHVYLYNN